MKKIVLASAVAAVMASGAAAAETSVYGNIRLQLESAEQVSMESGKLVVGFKASEDLGNGMTGYMQLEMEHDRAAEHSGGLGWQNDRSYVGLKGGFGAIQLGVQGDAAGFACGGTDVFTNNSGAACGVGAVNGDLDDAVVYVNSFGAVTAVLGVTFNGSQDRTPGGDDDTSHNLIALKFDAGDLSLGLQATNLDGGTGGTDRTITVLGGTYTMGDITVGVTLGDNDTSSNSDAMAVAVSIANVAGGTVMIGTDMGDALDVTKGGAYDDNGTPADTSDDTQETGEVVNIEYKKSLSKAVYAGVQYSSLDRSSGRDEDADQIYGYLGMTF